MQLVVGILQSPSTIQNSFTVFVSKESCENWTRALEFPSTGSMTSLNFDFI